ncbi:predicted protein [Uncinocarpus reesii 1704]|uniref:Uncharacterized protein n=1 Tax=Uncinocarpus reesii (strain UAMH 1704) TaxID=336963 RepID=C4JG64_UNCRE|nr:uncharacterized protein UREG_02462 [Uncinocarpus reesii 1704]EEP77613.1 predicted protein [Uncinocarpus reesii 1704]
MCQVYSRNSDGNPARLQAFIHFDCQGVGDRPQGPKTQDSKKIKTHAKNMKNKKRFRHRQDSNLRLRRDWIS